MQEVKKKLPKIHHWYKVTAFLILYDAIAVSGAYFLALWIRFDCKFSLIEPMFFEPFLKYIPINTVVCITVFWIMRLYQSIWRFASYSELSRVSIACLITSGIHVIAITLIYGRMPITYYCFGAVIQLVLVLGIRFSYRFVLLERDKVRHVYADVKVGRVMLIGAGNAGQMILRDVNHTRRTGDKVVCIIDDNPNKWKRYIDDVPIVGGRDDILLNVEKYDVDKIYIAIPSLSLSEKKELLNICNETSCTLKDLPGIYQFTNGDVTVSEMKDVAIEDLLGREQVKVNIDEILSQLSGKTVLVTGGGGSIGSELCRQIAAHKPGKLIIFDVYENNAYEIEQELKAKYGSELNLITLIGSVRDSRRIFSVFKEYKPDIVYHAAAHKHVPLMETSPCEAVKNNVLGTYKTAYAAVCNGCSRFVLISTDKAVNPTNVMGATKRLCEMVIQSFDKIVKTGEFEKLPPLYLHADDEEDGIDKPSVIRSSTEFVAVRFGNVLGSNGSVIPLFKKQILAGGPVTVTHPDIIRYFMTIPEAVSLVLQAGTYAKGGEIFVLDMGEPMKIDTLARNLIRLSGFKPDEDIKIEYSGLRPGEKLYEEKLMDEEGMEKTPNQLIFIGSPIEFDKYEFITNVQRLMKECYDNSDDIRTLIEEMVPTYHPANN